MKNNNDNLIRLEDLSKVADSIIEGEFNISDSDFSFMSTDNKIRDEINSHLKIYSDKYGKDFSFDSIEENLKKAANLTKLERSQLVAIFGNDISVSAFFMEYKAVKTVLGYFDKFLNSVSSNEQVVAEEFSAGLVKVILDFIPKIAKIREQYSVNNIDQVLGNDPLKLMNRVDRNKEFQRLRDKVTKNT